MIIRTINLRDLSEYQINRCVDEESLELRKRDAVSDSQVPLYLVTCRVYRKQVVAELVNMLNLALKYFQKRSSFTSLIIPYNLHKL